MRHTETIQNVERYYHLSIGPPQGKRTLNNEALKVCAYLMVNELNMRVATVTDILGFKDRNSVYRFLKSDISLPSLTGPSIEEVIDDIRQGVYFTEAEAQEKKPKKKSTHIITIKNRPGKRYQYYISEKGKHVFIGSYYTKDEAFEAKLKGPKVARRDYLASLPEKYRKKKQ